MICACLVGFCACAIPTSPKHSWNIFLFTCIYRMCIPYIYNLMLAVQYLPVCSAYACYAVQSFVLSMSSIEDLPTAMNAEPRCKLRKMGSKRRLQRREERLTMLRIRDRAKRASLQHRH